MDYPILLKDQLKQHLRSLRKTRGLSQAKLAKLMGVTQARMAVIEGDPSVVSVGQLFEILRLLDAQLLLRDLTTAPPQDSKPKGVW